MKKSPIAGKHIWFAVLLRLAKVFSPIISRWEKERIKKAKKEGEKVSPIFIIGAPRCGSTFLYQALTDRFRVHYIDNLAHIFYKNLYTGCLASERIYGDQGHGNFDSREGNTVHAGLHAPSECGPFWYLAFPKAAPGPDTPTPDPELLSRIADPINATMGRDGTPFLVKNLMNVERLSTLKELFPKARFLILKRARIPTALSILKARERLGVPSDSWWSARPTNYKELKELPIYERIAAQVHYLEEDIDREMEDISNERKETLYYEDLCSSPGSEIRRAKEGILKDLHQRDIPSPSIPCLSNPKREEATGSIREAFKKLGLPFNE